MISKSEIKLIRGLKNKKQRDKLNLFVSEGVKLVEHFHKSGLKLKYLFVIDSYQGPLLTYGNVIEVNEMKQVSFLDSPSPILGVFEKPSFEISLNGNLLLALDGVRDPGNMGTIIRLADWFGVPTILLANDCVDVFNPKVIQSTMGSLSNVQLIEGELGDGLQKLKKDGYSIVGAEMNGVPMQKLEKNRKLVLVMGNEANGISTEIQAVLNESVTIEKSANASAESLNVGTATAILLGNLANL